MDLTKSLLDLTVGGSTWVLWLLLGLSVASVAIMIDKTLIFYRHRFNQDRFVAEIKTSLRQEDWPRIISRCEQERSMEARVLLVGLREIPRSKAAVQDIMKGERLQVGLYLGKRLGFLGTLGANAPFIGLFGTVLGIIHAFKDLALAEGGGGPAVMAGIAEALIATAVGLLVAIPAVVMYNLFHHRLQVVLERSRVLEQLLLAHLDGATGTAEISIPDVELSKSPRRVGRLV
ncbi:MotA/TolQ/ExbB proton channel family protein [Desulfobacca acetoxidans]|uniref:MotA/TolQ/ExbB proton channel n=1 Tax=Desulfobacca acetoxidans (strain ATCC 700848 / DSM 11109 / ASRB2) TaxID=880072 RepID=F2NCG9_DESAR|nr:MotA/TolQ/ExbB proton channel family protein [Desulfobacca acetoxidans]AEB09103.1 MotA/TolQ/ExbB proton channel [Desulfobacca acetoxidans DSM 11109]